MSTASINRLITSGRILILALTLSLILSIPSAAFQKFHGEHGPPKVNYDSLFENATVLDQSEEGQKLLDDCIKAYGGREKLEALKSLKIHWRMIGMASEDTIDVIKTIKFNRQYKVEVHKPDNFEMRIINGNDAWHQNKDTVIFLDQGRYKAELFSYLVLAMPLAAVNERFDEIRYGNRGEGDPMSYLYFQKDDSLMMVVGIDRQDKYIKNIEGVIRQGESNFIFVNRFTAFFNHDDWIFPHQMINISMGLTVGESFLKEIEINPTIEINEFAPNPSRGDM